jgi:hypothetical protein
MAKYTVYVTERLVYAVSVEAESEQQAQDKVESGVEDYGTGRIVDVDGWDVTKVELNDWQN